MNCDCHGITSFIAGIQDCGDGLQAKRPHCLDAPAWHVWIHPHTQGLAVFSDAVHDHSMGACKQGEQRGLSRCATCAAVPRAPLCLTSLNVRHAAFTPHPPARSSIGNLHCLVQGIKPHPEQPRRRTVNAPAPWRNPAPAWHPQRSCWRCCSKEAAGEPSRRRVAMQFAREALPHAALLLHRPLGQC